MHGDEGATQSEVLTIEYGASCRFGGYAWKAAEEYPGSAMGSREKKMPDAEHPGVPSARPVRVDLARYGKLPETAGTQKKNEMIREWAARKGGRTAGGSQQKTE